MECNSLLKASTRSANDDKRIKKKHRMFSTSVTTQIKVAMELVSALLLPELCDVLITSTLFPQL